MRHPRHLLVLVVVLTGIALAAYSTEAHPLGNFSINHYSALRVDLNGVVITYVIDMAEIPTFQELQSAGLVPDSGHPSVTAYLAQVTRDFGSRLHLDVNGARLPLRTRSSGATFAPGAGDLPTLKVHALYEASLDGADLRQLNELRYRDENFADRAGWREIIAVAGPSTSLAASSAPERDRSRALTDYPSDLLSSPPQDVEARVLFSAAAPPAASSATLPSPARATPGPGVEPRVPRVTGAIASARASTPIVARPDDPARTVGVPVPAVGAPSRPNAPRTIFTELVTSRQLSFGVIFLAIVTALGVGAAHALEPGHGKAVVAAYLVGSRGTARHAVFLGLVVTVSHTAGVFLLGLITLYASRYIVPERLYPWLGAASGLTIAGLGAWLFLRRYAAPASGGHDHGHAHSRTHHGAAGDHDHPHADGHAHAHDHPHGRHHRHHPTSASWRELCALGITGGILPCPAALVVLLSAIALRRTGFGLLLIVAFSVGLAAVLIAIGLLMVYARRFMARVHGDGLIVRRWLPLTSAAIMTALGIAIALQALMAAGIVEVRL